MPAEISFILFITAVLTSPVIISYWAHHCIHRLINFEFIRADNARASGEGVNRSMEREVERRRGERVCESYSEIVSTI